MVIPPVACHVDFKVVTEGCDKVVDVVAVKMQVALKGGIKRDSVRLDTGEVRDEMPDAIRERLLFGQVACPVLWIRVRPKVNVLARLRGGLESCLCPPSFLRGTKGGAALRST